MQKERQQLKNRIISGEKSIEEQKCFYDSKQCTIACKYYRTCIHSPLKDRR